MKENTYQRHRKAMKIVREAANRVHGNCEDDAHFGKPYKGCACYICEARRLLGHKENK